MTADPHSVVDLDRQEPRSARLDQERHGPHEHPSDCRCRECAAAEWRASEQAQR